MPEVITQTPWEEIRTCIEQGSATALQEVIDRLPSSDVARALTRLTDEERNRLIKLMDPEDAADLIEELEDSQGADIIEDLPAHEAAPIFDAMESDRRADILGEMEEDDAEAIMSRMVPEEAEDVRELLQYHEETAGGIMITEYLAYHPDTEVGTVLRDIRDRAESHDESGMPYAYVISDKEKLIGVLRLRDVLLAPSHTRVRELMVINPIYVFTDTDLQELDDIFDRYPFWGIPVIDEKGVMSGVVRRVDMEEAWGDAQGRSFLRFSGIVTGDELRSMPVWERSRRRLAWLLLNMLLSMMAASVILAYQGTVDKLFALVFFMPIIANMSGCSGNQAVAVSIRELVLGLIKPEDFFHVWRKEVVVGLINGACLGGILGTVATLIWHQSPFLGVVIGLAFFLNVMVAVSLGGLIPLLLRFFKIDPALGAPPVLTTLTDMCGFMLVLGLATAALMLGVL
ncbi:MAG: magnesium transporter [Candidatus Hydrogenedens sp.]|nr:magnesium transporter [Candidatus Hydrogenedentota bacterium]NLF58420.1 magnesium transporter [Candidatus Hydrogenedens sp.]